MADVLKLHQLAADGRGAAGGAAGGEYLSQRIIDADDQTRLLTRFGRRS